MGGTDSEEDSDQFINIRNQASLSLAGNFVDAGISFLGLVLFANVLGADGLGKFYVVLAVVKVCLFPIAGIGQSVMKRGSERNLSPAVFFGGGLVYGFVYAVLAGVVVATIALVDSTLLQYSSEVVIGAFAVFVSRIFYMLLLDTYRSHGQTGFATLTDNAHGIVETGIQVIFLLAGFGVTGLLAGTALTTIGASVILFGISRVEIARPSFNTLRSIAKFARWSVLTSGLGTVYDRLPVLVLGIVLGNDVAGYYTSAMRLLMIGSYVGGSIAPALMVRVSSKTAVDTTNVFSDYRFSLRYAAVLAIPIMFGGFAIPDALMSTVFGPTFANTGAVLATLGIYHVFNTYNTVSSSFFDGIDRPELSMELTGISLVIRIICIVISITSFGIMGVISAVILSHAVKLAITILIFHSKFDRTIIPVQISYQFVSGLLMWGLIEYSLKWIVISGWGSLLAVVGLGSIIYIITLTTLDEYLRHTVNDLINDLVRVLRK